MYYASASVTWLVLQLYLKLPKFLFKIPLLGVFKFVIFNSWIAALILYFRETLKMPEYNELIFLLL